MEINKDTWDLIVIGGGPAGMMSAGTAAARGLKVLLLEKNPTLGKKLRITGGGRCNLTNATFDNHALLAKFTGADKFLFSAFAQYSVVDTLSFFNNLGLNTKVEAENRVFPTSEKAEDVALTMEKFLRNYSVNVITNISVKSLVSKDKNIVCVQTNAGDFFGKSFILATGGTSRPETGSTGDGYLWLKKIGHRVIDNIPSLVPITVKETWVKDLAGLSIQDTNISIYQDDLLVTKSVGKVLFTHNGLSGPGILNLSNTIGEALVHGKVFLKINLSPLYSEEELLHILKEACINSANKKIKNVLGEIIPSSLVPIVLKISNIDTERQCNTITRQERHLLIINIRGLKLEVGKLLGSDKAIVSSGGVDLTEVDFRTMQSKLFKNLYLIGDILNVNRPSGGYSLQLCWTTGFVAGNSCPK
jgi:predicted Rossmann fold flavoprotein